MKFRLRALALLLSAVMVLTFMPALAFADDTENEEYDFWIDIYQSYDNYIVYSDGSRKFVVENGDGGSGYELKIQVGTGYSDDWDKWTGLLEEGTDYTVDGNSVTLIGGSIYEKVKDTSDVVYIGAGFIDGNGECVYSDYREVQVCDVYEAYWFNFNFEENPSYIDLFPAESVTLRQNFYASVENNKYPWGEELNCKVTAATSTNKSVFTVTKKPVKNSKGKILRYYWVIKGVAEGTAKLKITYNGSKTGMIHYVPVTVTKDKLSGWIQTDEYDWVLPGESIDFHIDAFYESRNAYDDTGLTYEWFIAEKDAAYATVAAKEDDPSKATVTFNMFNPGRRDKDIEVCVKVTYTTKAGRYLEKVFTRECSADSEVNQIYPYDIDNIDIGKSYTFKPRLSTGRYDPETNTAERYDREGVTFKFTSTNSKALKITKNDDGSYTLNRLNGGEAEVDLRAFWNETYTEDDHTYTEEIEGPQMEYYFEQIRLNLSNYRIEFADASFNSWGDAYYIDQSNEGITPEVRVVDEHGYELPKEEYTLVVAKAPNRNSETFNTSSFPLKFDYNEKRPWDLGTASYMIYAKATANNPRGFTGTSEKGYVNVYSDKTLVPPAGQVKFADKFVQYKNSKSDWDYRYNIPLDVQLTSDDFQVVVCAGDETKEKALDPATDFKVKYINQANGEALDEYPTTTGNYIMSVEGQGEYYGTNEDINLYVGQKNPIKVSKTTKTVKLAKVKKAKQVVKPLTVTGAKGKVHYQKTGGSARLLVNKTTGKVTVKKGTKKGTYKCWIWVGADGDATYAPEDKYIQVTVKVVK